MALRFLISESDGILIGTEALACLARRYGSFFLEGIGAAVEISSADLDTMREYNKRYRQIDEPTDVLSFPLFPGLEALASLPKDGEVLLGSILLCPDKAAAYGETLPQLVHHGLLHLLGYDHETDFSEWHGHESAVLETLAQDGLSIPEVQP